MSRRRGRLRQFGEDLDGRRLVDDAAGVGIGGYESALVFNFAESLRTLTKHRLRSQSGRSHSVPNSFASWMPSVFAMTGPVTKSSLAMLLVLSLSLIMATEDGHAAKQSRDSNCMIRLLQSYGIPSKRAIIYAQRMASKRIDELTLRMYSDNTLFLHLHLQTLGIKGDDLARVMACTHGGTGAKSRRCKKTPCGVKGTCAFTQKSRQKYVCDCQAGYTGQHCGKDMCSPNPCRHKGTCYHAARGFLCLCPKGYMGRMCEKTINECASSPCQNGGMCEDGLLKYTCKCPFGFNGVHCEKQWFIAARYKKLEQTVKLQQVEIKSQQAEIKSQQVEIKRQQAEIKSQRECKAVRGVINWRQKSGRYAASANNAQLFSMLFKKKRSDTHLRLTWSSNMRQLYQGKCSQWYFTIDSLQCTNPAPINGNVYHNVHAGGHFDGHRHGTIIGVCRGTGAGNIQAGNHNIAMHVRNCPGYSGSDAHTGWHSTTSMIVEELCPPQ